MKIFFSLSSRCLYSIATLHRYTYYTLLDSSSTGACSEIELYDCLWCCTPCLTLIFSSHWFFDFIEMVICIQSCIYTGTQVHIDRNQHHLVACADVNTARCTELHHTTLTLCPRRALITDITLIQFYSTCSNSAP